MFEYNNSFKLLLPEDNNQVGVYNSNECIFICIRGNERSRMIEEKKWEISKWVMKCTKLYVWINRARKYL